MEAFYVTAIDGGRVYYMHGPHEEHKSALDLVNDVREVACTLDPRAHFMAWGTVKTTRSVPATMNELIAKKCLRSVQLEAEVRGLRGMINDLLAYINRIDVMASHDEAYSSTIREIASDAMQHGRKVFDKK